MFDTEKSGGKFLAAVFSLAVSAVFFATAIIPAMPGGVLV
ncbi:recombination protein F [Qipengyuania huizhouensis]|nr:recombination protein F [Qipengyuania huizhouensis]MBA4764804.1 recombination protein F [Erythrobacter sp.]MBL4857920.1 recombination protein F [Erythrobacter sp.]MBX7460691.1 recombination protein F [Qipengyuania huizhouensis]